MGGFRAFVGQLSALRVARLPRGLRWFWAPRRAGQGQRRGCCGVRPPLLGQATARELRGAAHLLAGALRLLACCALPVLLAFLVFAVFLADGGAAFVAQGGGVVQAGSSNLLQDLGGSLSGAVLSLGLALIGRGWNWAQLWEALGPLPVSYRVAFLSVTTLAIAVALAAAAAAAADAAARLARRDQRHVARQEAEQQEKTAAALRLTLAGLDSSGRGIFSLEELYRLMQDEEIVSVMSALDLDPNRVKTLLVLLDRDSSGEVELGDFVEGCLRLKGLAKGQDVAILQYQVEWILHSTAALANFLEDRFDLLLEENRRSSAGSPRPSRTDLPPTPLGPKGGRFPGMPAGSPLHLW